MTSCVKLFLIVLFLYDGVIRLLQVNFKWLKILFSEIVKTISLTFLDKRLIKKIRERLMQSLNFLIA